MLTKILYTPKAHHLVTWHEKREPTLMTPRRPLFRGQFRIIYACFYYIIWVLYYCYIALNSIERRQRRRCWMTVGGCIVSCTSFSRSHPDAFSIAKLLIATRSSKYESKRNIFHVLQRNQKIVFGCLTKLFRKSEVVICIRIGAFPLLIWYTFWKIPKSYYVVYEK